MFQNGSLDPFFIRLEHQLFGRQPSLDWMEAWPFLIVSEVMYAAYFSYYIMIAGIALALFFQSREQFFHYVSVISFVFYICYLCYIFLPVIGPRVFFTNTAGGQLPNDIRPEKTPSYPPAVQEGPFCQTMRWIYETFAIQGAAFPSSHVAVALGTLYFSALYLRRIRSLHLAAFLLLCLSTIYCRYHYVVDVLAGVVTGGVLTLLGDWLYRRFQAPNSRGSRTSGQGESL
jgi:membrane-associated phospholipid phosphatase